MADIPKLLTLSKQIAAKARKLIPRSSNRVIFGDPDDSDEAQDSQWSNAPTYVQLQIMAQRARSSQNQYRKLIDQVNDDLKMRGTETEEEKNKAVLKAIKEGGYDVNKIALALKSAKRSDKKYHKAKGFKSFFTSKGDKVTTMESQESNAKNAVRFRVGNCGENASLALVMFAEYPGPGDDLNLPALANDVNQRPLIERVAASNPGDHAFVVVNRPPGDIQNIDAWMVGTVIICDPWWFHSGDAFLGSDKTGEKKDLLEYIEENKTGLKVSGMPIRLGQGHSKRYRDGKYKNINYYSNSIDSIEKALRT